MSIRQAVLSETSTVKRISEITISEIYPHYYPNGAVEFFLNHHSEKSIIEDIESNRVFLCLDREQNIVGTVTINKNEICRLFVLPTYQGYGYGTEMLDYAEKSIKHYLQKRSIENVDIQKENLKQFKQAAMIFYAMMLW